MKKISHSIDTSEYLKRLNYNELHSPADPFFIKRDQTLLLKCLESHHQVENFISRANPQVKQRFELFPIVQSDLKRFQIKQDLIRTSPRDPFLSITPQLKYYKPLHSTPCKPLGVLTNQLKQTNAYQRPSQEISDELRDFEKRFFPSNSSQHNFKKSDAEQNQSKKPLQKIDTKDARILQNCQREVDSILRKVPQDTHIVEMASDKIFNQSMTVELANVLNSTAPVKTQWRTKRLQLPLPELLDEVKRPRTYISHLPSPRTRFMSLTTMKKQLEPMTQNVQLILRMRRQSQSVMSSKRS